MRMCGSCSLCCKLVPVADLNKRANERCRYQSHAKGCRVYETAKMPRACRVWNCAWLEDERLTHRPDRAHYVVDVLPDFVSIRDDDTGKRDNVPVIQVWCDAGFPDAHRDPALRAYLATFGAHGIAALVRYGESEAFLLFPPAMSSTGDFAEITTSVKSENEHSVAEIAQVWSGER